MTVFQQGRKQFITIVPSIIEYAPVLILDEAASSADTRTEILIQNAMRRKMNRVIIYFLQWRNGLYI